MPRFKQKEKKMKKINQLSKIILRSVLFMLLTVSAHAATNQANNVTGGSQTLTASGLVTVNSSTLQLVKQVYDSAGTCLASIPADAACSSSATTTTVPAGTTLKMLIFVKNSTSVGLTDIRFADALDVSGTGFTYLAGNIRRTQIGASAPADTATAAAIFADANGGTGTALTDAVGAPDDQASFVSPNLTVGGTTNTTVVINANKAYGILFQATKN
jgi:hypothetical protein